MARKCQYGGFFIPIKRTPLTGKLTFNFRKGGELNKVYKSENGSDDAAF